MATTKPPPRPSPKDWPCIQRPKGMETRPLVRSILAAQGLSVITDMLENCSYWAIVKGQDPDAAPHALLCQTSRGRSPRDMHYLIAREQMGFPEIPPRAFFSRILANCPVPPSDIAATGRARAVRRYAELDAMPDYPVGTEFTILGKRLRIIEPLGEVSCTAIDLADRGRYLIKREHLLSATIHAADESAPERSGPDDDQQ